MDPNSLPQGMPPMPPTPTDAGMPAPVPGVSMGADQPVSEEEKRALLDMIEKIKAQLGDLNATRFASSNKTEALRKDLLRQVFEKLQLAGVDLSSRESVAAFIMRLQEQNPELAQMFEKSMDVLLGTAESGSFGAPPEMAAPPSGGLPPPGLDVPQDPNAQPPMIG